MIGWAWGWRPESGAIPNLDQCPFTRLMALVGGEREVTGIGTKDALLSRVARSGPWQPTGDLVANRVLTRQATQRIGPVGPGGLGQGWPGRRAGLPVPRRCVRGPAKCIQLSAFCRQIVCK